MPKPAKNVPNDNAALVRRVLIGSPFMEEVVCGTTVTVAGTLGPAPSGTVTVTASWTLTGGTGPAPTAQSTTTSTANWSIPFTGVNPGVYSITATCAGYSDNTVTDVTVSDCARAAKAGPAKSHGVLESRVESLLVIQDRIPNNIEDALYVLVALERAADRRLFDARADASVASGWYRTHFLLVPAGRYYARITIHRLDHAATHMSKVIDV